MSIFGSYALRLYAAIALCVILTTSSMSASDSSGTSEVVLVDVSKSFVPLTKADERSIQAVADASALLAEHNWASPVSFLWSKIQSASLIASPLCGPFVFEQRLIKTDKSITPADLRKKLKECLNVAVLAASTPSEEARYTDISGALTLASEQGESLPRNGRYVIVISDFVEDLPAGMKEIPLKLAGEHFLLLHRTGTQDLVIGNHLERIAKWVDKLRRAGAASVVALPLQSITSTRVIHALMQEGREGTSVAVLQNLPDTAKSETLHTIADAIVNSARDWPSPVTVTWAEVPSRAARIVQMPPAEFAPRLIKTNDSGTPDFPALLNEISLGMSRFSPGVSNADLVGIIEMYASAAQLEKNNVLIVASHLPELKSSDWSDHHDFAGLRVIVLAGPNRKDESNQGAYLARVQGWQKWLQERHANVCKLPINGMTESTLGGCLNGH